MSLATSHNGNTLRASYTLESQPLLFLDKHSNFIKENATVIDYP
jgi:hypothetical protein